MNNAEFERPTPRALSDAELNAALEEAKQSPDGLLAAMILLEQQEQVRREDAEALRAWEESRFNSLLTSSHETVTVDEASNEVRLSPEPEDIAEPESQYPDLENLDSDLDDEVPFEPISASEVTVTTTLNQIVADVNEAFEHPSAAEDATALEEAERVGETDIFASEGEQPLSVSSTDNVGVSPAKSPKTKRTKSPLTFDWKSLAVPVVLSCLFLTNGYSLGNVLVGSLAGALVSGVIAFGFARSKSRGISSHQVLSRATFGVWGAVLPTKVLFLIRLAALGALIWVATQELFMISALPAGLVKLGSIEWSNQGTVAVVVVFVVWLLLLAPKIVKWSLVALATLGLAVTAIALTSLVVLPAIALDSFSVLSIALIYVVCDALLVGPSNLPVVSSAGVFSLVKALSLKQILPAFLTAGVSVVAISTDSIFHIIGFCIAALAVSVALLTQIQSDLSAVRFAKPWMIVISLVLSIAAVVLVSQQNVPALITSSLTSFLSLAIAAQLPYWFESFMRSDAYHELSLQRGYAFYRRFGVASLFGFVSLALVSVVLSPLGVGGSDEGLLGFATIPLLIAALSIVFTLSTSWYRIRYQQGEVRNIEVRRNQLAGFDTYE